MVRIRHHVLPEPSDRPARNAYHDDNHHHNNEATNGDNLGATTTTTTSPGSTITTTTVPGSTTTTTATTVPGSTTTTTTVRGPPPATEEPPPASPPQAELDAQLPDDPALSPLAGQADESGSPLIGDGLAVSLINGLELVIPPWVADGLVSPLLILGFLVQAMTDSAEAILMPALLLTLGMIWIVAENRLSAFATARRRDEPGEEA